MERTNLVYILDVALYPSRANGRKTGVHAVLINNRIINPGRAVMFSTGGKDFYGDVVSCIQVEKDGEVYRFFANIAGSAPMVVDLRPEKTNSNPSYQSIM